MDKQPHGNFIAFMNRKKQPGDNKPTFDGRLAIPGADEELASPCGRTEYEHPKTGEKQIMFNGQTDAVAPSATAMDQVAALIKQAPAAEQSEAVFGNLKLALASTRVVPQRVQGRSSGKEPSRLLGGLQSWQRRAVVRISVRAKKDRNQHAMLGRCNELSHPRQERGPAAGCGARNSRSLSKAGAVTKGMPKAKDGRGSRARA